MGQVQILILGTKVDSSALNNKKNNNFTENAIKIYQKIFLMYINNSNVLLIFRLITGIFFY